MHARTATILVSMLLGLALAPWIVSSCAPNPLLPDELRQKRENYEATVEAAQDAAIQEMRENESEVEVIALGTTTADDAGPLATATAIIITSTLPLSSPTPGLPGETAIPDLIGSVVPATTTIGISVTAATISTTVPAETPTLTTRRIVIRSGESVQSLTETAAISVTQDSTTPVSAALPVGMVATEDLITAQMLAEQIRRDTDATLSELTVNLSANGISAVGAFSVLPGFNRILETEGSFAVENESLVVNVSSVRLDGRNVTEQYRGELEDGVNSSLYRLLPQRYVQSFELMDGQVLVHSQVRP